MIRKKNPSPARSKRSRPSSAGLLAPYTLQKLVAKKIAGKRIILRLDLNVPLDRGEIEDTFRLKAALPTLRLLLAKKAKVIVIAHLGADGRASLLSVADYFRRHFPVVFIPNLADLTALDKLASGEVALLENIRREVGEMKNSPLLARRLATLGDYYVNEAFSASHRRHASLVGLPRLLPSYVGLQFVREYQALSQAFQPRKPFVFILGGKKFSTKVPLLKKFLPRADQILIGGALANSFFYKLGYPIGLSVAEKNLPGLTPLLRRKKIHLPLDVVTETAGRLAVKKPEAVQGRDKIVDVGPETIKYWSDLISSARLVLWNGPLGFYEGSYQTATRRLARAISESHAISLVGGGDTVAVLAQSGHAHNFTFLSTAGGALLDFLAHGTLPGIEAITKQG